MFGHIRIAANADHSNVTFAGKCLGLGSVEAGQPAARSSQNAADLRAEIFVLEPEEHSRDYLDARPRSYRGSVARRRAGIRITVASLTGVADIAGPKGALRGRDKVGERSDFLSSATTAFDEEKHRHDTLILIFF